MTDAPFIVDVLLDEAMNRRGFFGLLGRAAAGAAVAPAALGAIGQAAPVAPAAAAPAAPAAFTLPAGWTVNMQRAFEQIKERFINQRTYGFIQPETGVEFPPSTLEDATARWAKHAHKFYATLANPDARLDRALGLRKSPPYSVDDPQGEKWTKNKEREDWEQRVQRDRERVQQQKAHAVERERQEQERERVVQDQPPPAQREPRQVWPPKAERRRDEEPPSDEDYMPESIVDILLEAPPDVEALYRKLAGRMDQLHRKVRGDPDKFYRLVNKDKLLSGYLEVDPRESTGGRYRNDTRKIVLAAKSYLLMLNALRHELVHREQHRRSGYKSLHSGAYRRSVADYKRYFKRGFAYPEQAGPAYAASQKLQREYFADPVETQAYGVEAAAKLKRMSPSKAAEVMRSGGPDFYKAGYGGGQRPEEKRGKRRYLKNMYQAYTQAESIIDSLLEADPDNLRHRDPRPAADVVRDILRRVPPLLQDADYAVEPDAFPGHIFALKDRTHNLTGLFRLGKQDKSGFSLHGAVWKDLSDIERQLGSEEEHGLEDILAKKRFSILWGENYEHTAQEVAQFLDRGVRSAVQGAPEPEHSPEEEERRKGNLMRAVFGDDVDVEAMWDKLRDKLLPHEKEEEPAPPEETWKQEPQPEPAVPAPSVSQQIDALQAQIAQEADPERKRQLQQQAMRLMAQESIVKAQRKSPKAIVDSLLDEAINPAEVARIMGKASWRAQRLKAKGWTPKDFVKVLLNGPMSQKEVADEVAKRRRVMGEATQNRYNPKGLRLDRHGVLRDKWGREMQTDWDEFEKRRVKREHVGQPYPPGQKNPLHNATTTAAEMARRKLGS